ncbi:MAG TPA: LysR family transcriptional regulator [Paracoccaceae bacterium]|nr:LysR family transcriptional regulator [Paracoccaceae bacterium]
MFMRRGIKLAHLRLLAVLVQTGQVGAAASALGLTQPAASRLLAEAERIAGTALHQRTGRGVALTPAGEALARRAQQVLIDLDDAGREVAEIAEGRFGQVRVGAVTGPALDHVLPAVERARDALPGVSVEVVVATSDVLCEGVAAGRLDFALARLPGDAGATGFAYAEVAPEPVVIAARRGHPLADGRRVAPADLMAFDWVMPAPEAVLARTVRARLRAMGLPDPPGRVATASFLFTLALLADSDAVAPLARAVAMRFAGGGGAGIAVLPADLGIEVAPWGLVTHAGAGLTPSAARLRDMILPAEPVA